MSTSELAERWLGAFGVDIRSELHDVAAIELYRCEQTGLRFFWPPEVAGSEALYDQLARHEWYYLANKWEHMRALQDLGQARTVLEVGCGAGAFLKLAQQRLAVPCVGVELNASAAEAARASGLSVEAGDSIDRWLQSGRVFDAVCAFQVLEHIVAPRDLLGQLVGLLAPRSRLLLSVPNYQSHLGSDAENLLDMPPHHMTQWDRGSLEAIGRLFNLRLVDVAYEPLATYHVDWYCTLLAKQLPSRITKRLETALISRVLRPLLKTSSALRSRVKGQGIYVCFERNP